MILNLEMLKLKKKIKLSNILEKVEVDSESKKIIEMLDNYHSNPKAHVVGITGPPGVGKSSLINNLTCCDNSLLALESLTSEIIPRILAS